MLATKAIILLVIEIKKTR